MKSVFAIWVLILFTAPLAAAGTELYQGEDGNFMKVSGNEVSSLNGSNWEKFAELREDGSLLLVNPTPDLSFKFVKGAQNAKLVIAFKEQIVDEQDYVRSSEEATTTAIRAYKATLGKLLGAWNLRQYQSENGKPIQLNSADIEEAVTAIQRVLDSGKLEPVTISKGGSELRAVEVAGFIDILGEVTDEKTVSFEPIQIRFEPEENAIVNGLKTRFELLYDQSIGLPTSKEDMDSTSATGEVRGTLFKIVSLSSTEMVLRKDYEIDGVPTFDIFKFAKM